jgi:hypothetical protein
MACGDGVIQTGCGEQCDDGASNGDDRSCDSSCQLVDRDGDGVSDRDDPCTGPAAILAPTLKLRHLKTLPGDDKLNLTGRFAVAVPFQPALDPVARGVRLMIAGTTRQLLDTTISGGRYDPRSGIGWKANKTGTAWTYVNPTSGNTRGIYSVTIRETSADDSVLLSFTAKGRRGAYAVGTADLPLSTQFILDSPTADTGQCGEARFTGPRPVPLCTFNRSASTLTCR